LKRFPCTGLTEPWEVMGTPELSTWRNGFSWSQEFPGKPHATPGNRNSILGLVDFIAH
jgi:hypothetical protein